MTPWKARKDVAFVVVDVQNDFCPGGNLGVTDGDKIIPVINDISPHFDTRVFTQDWHPHGHKSFASAHGRNPFETTTMPYGVQVLWPDHCEQGTHGAEFHKNLNIGPWDFLLRKGTNPDIDSYSAFFENDRKTQPRFGDGRTFTEMMRDHGVRTLVFAGLAFDYCVGWNALDAKAEGFDVYVVMDATKGIAPDSIKDMEDKLQAAKVKMINASDLRAAVGAVSSPKKHPSPAPKP